MCHGENYISRLSPILVQKFKQGKLSKPQAADCQVTVKEVGRKIHYLKKSREFPLSITHCSIFFIILFIKN